MRLAWREALLAFRRAPVLSALSITTIAFSLFAFGLFGLVALNIRDQLNQLEERVEIRAFVVDGTNAEATSAALGDIASFPEVSSVSWCRPMRRSPARAVNSASSVTCSRPASCPRRSTSSSRKDIVTRPRRGRRRTNQEL